MFLGRKVNQFRFRELIKEFFKTPGKYIVGARIKILSIRSEVIQEFNRRYHYRRSQRSLSQRRMCMTQNLVYLLDVIDSLKDCYGNIK